MNKQVSPLTADDKLAMKNITALGWVAFFGGLSQDMIVPILPLFYTQVLGLSKETVGLIEGSLNTVVSGSALALLAALLLSLFHIEPGKRSWNN